MGSLVDNTWLLHCLEIMYLADKWHSFPQTAKCFYHSHPWSHPVPLKTLWKWLWTLCVFICVLFHRKISCVCKTELFSMILTTMIVISTSTSSPFTYSSTIIFFFGVLSPVAGLAFWCQRNTKMPSKHGNFVFLFHVLYYMRWTDDDLKGQKYVTLLNIEECSCVVYFISGIFSI